MAIDTIGTILMLICFIQGYRRGAILAVFSVAAILLGTLCALKCSQSFSQWMLESGYVSSGWVQVVSYILLFVIVIFIVRLVARLLQRIAEGLFLGFVNRIIGALLYVFAGAVLWSSLLWIGLRMQIITPRAIAASHTFPWFSGLAPWVFEQAGKVIPYVKDTFARLDQFFDQVNQKIPGHVGTH